MLIIVPPIVVVVVVLSFSQFATHTRLSRSANERVAMNDDESAARNFQRALIENAEVVNNPAPNPAAPSFRLSRTPSVSIVAASAGDSSAVWAVRDADFTESGGIVVVNGATDVRIYDAQGRLARNIGRKGQGPGELSNSFAVQARSGDTILVWSYQPERLITFAAAGNPVRTTALPRSLVVRCCFTDGSVLLQSPPATGGPHANREDLPWSVAENSGGTAKAKIVALLKGKDPVSREGIAGSGSRGNSFMLTPPLPFARTDLVSISGTEFQYGIGDVYEYQVFSKAGALRRIVKASAVSLRPTASDISIARSAFIKSWSTELSEDVLARGFDRLVIPSSMPAYGAIKAERDGTVWVRNYVPDGQTLPEWWARFDPSGRLQGTLRLPDGLRVVRFQKERAIVRGATDANGFVPLYVFGIERTQ